MHQKDLKKLNFKSCLRIWRNDEMLPDMDFSWSQGCIGTEDPARRDEIDEGITEKLKIMK